MVAPPSCASRLRSECRMEILARPFTTSAIRYEPHDGLPRGRPGVRVRRLLRGALRVVLCWCDARDGRADRARAQPMDRAALDRLLRPGRLALSGAHGSHPLDRGI